MQFISSCVTGNAVKTRSQRDVAPNFYMADGSVGPDHLVHKDGILVLGVGNPLLDISCKVPMEVLTKYGVKSGDIILAEDAHAPLYDELVEKYAPEYIAGGATQNSIRVAQWMLGGDEYAGSTAYIGCIGDDKFGEQLTASAAADGPSDGRSDA